MSELLLKMVELYYWYNVVSSERTRKRTNETVEGLDAEQEKHRLDNTIIEISSDDGEDSDNDDDVDDDDNEDMDTDNCMNRDSLREDIKLSSSYNYPGTCMQKESFILFHTYYHDNYCIDPMQKWLPLTSVI